MVWAVLLVTAILGTDLLAWSATVGEGSGNPSVRAFSRSLGSGLETECNLALFWEENHPHLGSLLA